RWRRSTFTRTTRPPRTTTFALHPSSAVRWSESQIPGGSYAGSAGGGTGTRASPRCGPPTMPPGQCGVGRRTRWAAALQRSAAVGDVVAAVAGGQSGVGDLLVGLHVVAGCRFAFGSMCERLGGKQAEYSPEGAYRRGAVVLGSEVIGVDVQWCVRVRPGDEDA